MNKIPLTVRGAETLRAELEELKKVKRPAVIQAIAEARAHGDLKENAEYHAAREQQGFIEGRIKDIEGKLSHAQIIDVTKLPDLGPCEILSNDAVEPAEPPMKLAKINRADALSHTPSRDHRPGQRGGTVDIVICARADAAQQQLLDRTQPPAADHDQIDLGVRYATPFDRILDRWPAGEPVGHRPGDQARSS